MIKLPLPRQVFFEQLQHIQIIPLNTSVTAFWNDHPTASIFCTILSPLCIFIRPMCSLLFRSHQNHILFIITSYPKTLWNSLYPAHKDSRLFPILFR